jgi:hypothetical protein
MPVSAHLGSRVMGHEPGLLGDLRASLWFTAFDLLRRHISF